METKKESKRHAKNQKHCERNEECLGGLISKLKTAEERHDELDDTSVETS